ncbi:ABC transporter ATP-binding protein/permease [Calothrix sp. UHCC 0171]|uniref:ABC transporter ATP-binding protein/permease n=1 Tax=Calothrix sp. UHCC 0171 TaxID=3110245 RepID=UPI002B1ED8D0|nr:ABC transporter ATP-binding protein/permease [Calothrix sp. UHCC 0171]MEA5573658.1 ABC transporter ATP-binding protein/permease [Calothrix sp. UHCC 0171]
MQRFNLIILKKFWAIAKSYWSSDEKWYARGLLLLVILLSLGYTGLSVLLNNKRGVLISALSAQDEARFWQTILVFTGTLVIYAPLYAGYVYLRDRLGLQWRQWLTNYFSDRYFQNRAFYNLNYDHAEIDNPDQRITEDVKSFTYESLALLLAVVDSLLAIAAFSSVLWGISQPLIWFLVFYALIGTLTTVGVFGKPLMRLNFERLKKEADFRFSLVRVRENAEAIAFYQGEQYESDRIQGKFLEVFDNFKRLIFWELNLNILTNAYEFIPFILPAIVVAPGIFAGELEVGKVTEAQGAFIRVFFSLNLIVSRFQSLANFGAGVERLYSFLEFLETTDSTVNQPDGTEQPTIKTEIATDAPSPVENCLALENITLQTPNYQRILIENLSVKLLTGEGLLVRGPSGCGKSSLLRAIIGLWDAGTGTILRPPLAEILFLSQRPYMILGTLRDQLLYPNIDRLVEDADLREILIQVNLPNLEQTHGGFNTEQNWTQVLSLGEQQRLIFARLLLNKPKYAILDEATSALDPQNEKYLYQQLKDSGMTFLSVGHRESLSNYHQSILDFTTDRTWSLTTSKSLPTLTSNNLAKGDV